MKNKQSHSIEYSNIGPFIHDILNCIHHYLPMKDFSNFKLVAKSFYDVFHNSQYGQYVSGYTELEYLENHYRQLHYIPLQLKNSCSNQIIQFFFQPYVENNLFKMLPSERYDKHLVKKFIKLVLNNIDGAELTQNEKSALIALKTLASNLNPSIKYFPRFHPYKMASDDWGWIITVTLVLCVLLAGVIVGNLMAWSHVNFKKSWQETVAVYGSSLLGSAFAFGFAYFIFNHRPSDWFQKNKDIKNKLDTPPLHDPKRVISCFEKVGTLFQMVSDHAERLNQTSITVRPSI